MFLFWSNLFELIYGYNDWFGILGAGRSCLESHILPHFRAGGKYLVNFNTGAIIGHDFISMKNRARSPCACPPANFPPEEKSIGIQRAPSPAPGGMNNRVSDHAYKSRNREESKLNGRNKHTINRFISFGTRTAEFYFLRI